MLYEKRPPLRSAFLSRHPSRHAASSAFRPAKLPELASKTVFKGVRRPPRGSTRVREDDNQKAPPVAMDCHRHPDLLRVVVLAPGGWPIRRTLGLLVRSQSQRGFDVDPAKQRRRPYFGAGWLRGRFLSMAGQRRPPRFRAHRWPTLLFDLALDHRKDWSIRSYIPAGRGHVSDRFQRPRCHPLQDDKNVRAHRVRIEKNRIGLHCCVLVNLEGDSTQGI